MQSCTKCAKFFNFSRLFSQYCPQSESFVVQLFNIMYTELKRDANFKNKQVLQLNNMFDCDSNSGSLCTLDGFTVRWFTEPGIVTASRLSVRPSMTLKYRDHIGWNSAKIISRLVSLRCSLCADMDLLQGNRPKILAGIGPTRHTEPVTNPITV